MTWLVLGLLALTAVTFWPSIGLFAQWSRRQKALEKAAVEDALKHVLSAEHRGQIATVESLLGNLGISPSQAARLVRTMELRGLIQSTGGGIVATAEGERLGVHVVRAHRLWERYLSDDARMPMDRLHHAAEKQEHHLSEEKLAELEAHLGHPQRDPHGDPIPAAGGVLAEAPGVPLTDWPAGESAEVIHIEDEPDVLFRQIVATGLRPGSTLRVIEANAERVVVSDGESEHRLAPVVAANIQVGERIREAEIDPAWVRLSALGNGAAAVVTKIDPACRGFSRRRMLDLGLTEGARVESALQNPFGDPRAYRIRGTTIALRESQAAQIWVQPTHIAKEAVAS